MKESTYPAFALSFIAAMTYTFVMITVSLLGPSWLLDDGILEVFLGLFLLIILWPFVIAILLLGTAATILTIAGMSFIAAGKHRPGGIMVIVGSALGFFIALPVYLIPLIAGLLGGILAITHANDQ